MSYLFKAMKDAYSIYLADYVEAETCNYGDNIELGLKCPVCSSPVFLRKETVFMRGEKLVYIPAHFAHYKGVDPTECELRAASGEVKEKIARYKQARGQRLELFKAQFEAVLEGAIDKLISGDIAAHSLKKMRKFIGNSQLEISDIDVEVLAKNFLAHTQKVQGDFPNKIACEILQFAFTYNSKRNMHLLFGYGAYLLLLDKRLNDVIDNVKNEAEFMVECVIATADFLLLFDWERFITAIQANKNFLRPYRKAKGFGFKK